jgi:hypothetical protein
MKKTIFYPLTHVLYRICRHCVGIMEAWNMGIKVRESKGKLYLDIYWKGRRWWEPLHLSVCTDKKQHREILKMAEICRGKREAQIVSDEWGFLGLLAGKKALYAYVQGLSSKRTKTGRLHLMLGKLKDFPRGGEAIQIGQITAKWLEDFRGYLLKDCGLKQNSAASYYTAVCRLYGRRFGRISYQGTPPMG